LTQYLLSQRDLPGIERARLKLLEEKYDASTAGQLDAIGVSEGWRCVDVGAGAGSATRMLAARVGTTGSVLAIDLDTSLLQELASDRVEVRRLDLLSDGLPADTFDLVHARMLLMHLPSRLAAIRRLSSAARPGGWFAAADPDFTTVAVSPTNSTWERIWTVFCDTLISGGWDPRYGARLCGDLRAAGLVEVHADYMGSCDPGGSVNARLLSLTFERLRQRMLSLGADDHDINDAQVLLEDPATVICAPTTCFAHARRPDLSATTASE
jgi:SAM-dependent methyltransferase